VSALAGALVSVGVAASPVQASTGDTRSIIATAERAVARIGADIAIDRPSKIAGELTVPWADGAATSVDGSTVRRGSQGADAVVQHIEGGLRGLAVIHGAAAPTSFTYGLANGGFRQEPDGTVLAVDTSGKAVGIVSPAWAVDADGKRVETRYEVRNGQLVQHVAHAAAAHPVVADPSVSFGWYVYVRYSRGEVQDLRWAVEFNANAAGAICAIIPVPWVAIACYAIMTTQWNSIRDTWINAANRNQCMELRLTYVPAAVVGWRGYNC
jgi:hypothetical protein